MYYIFFKIFNNDVIICLSNTDMFENYILICPKLRNSCLNFSLLLFLFPIYNMDLHCLMSPQNLYKLLPLSYASDILKIPLICLNSIPFFFGFILPNFFYIDLYHTLNLSDHPSSTWPTHITLLSLIFPWSVPLLNYSSFNYSPSQPHNLFHTSILKF